MYKSALCNSLLNTINEQEQQKCVDMFIGEVVNFSLSGCNKVSIQPLICAKITNNGGKTILIETVDTTGKTCNMDYYLNLGTDITLKIENIYKCEVGSFVIDSEYNQPEMENYDKTYFDDKGIIIYTCSMHFLNILAADTQNLYINLQNDVNCVLQYFARETLPKTWYIRANGEPISGSVNYSTIEELDAKLDTLKIYSQNWAAMTKVSNNELLTLNFKKYVLLPHFFILPYTYI